MLLNAFSNGNLKPNGTDGSSQPITVTAFCRTNINDSLS